MMLKSFKEKGLLIEEITPEVYEAESQIQALAAKEVLRELITNSPDTTFVYNMGNQDCSFCFGDTLNELSQEFAEQFHWSPHYTLLNEKQLITHGDIEMRGYTNEDRNSRRYEHLKQLYPSWGTMSIVKDTIGGIISGAKFNDDSRYRDISPMSEYISEKFPKVESVMYGHRHHKPRTHVPHHGRSFHQLGAFYLQNSPEAITMELSCNGDKPNFTKTEDGNLTSSSLTIDEKSIELGMIMPYLSYKESPKFAR